MSDKPADTDITFIKNDTVLVEIYEDGSAILTIPDTVKHRAGFKLAKKFRDGIWRRRAMAIVRLPQKRSFQVVVFNITRDEETRRRLMRKGLIR